MVRWAGRRDLGDKNPKNEQKRETCLVAESSVLDVVGLTRVSICALPTDTPSSPSIDQVEPYSSTAQVQFDEPEATGGVPILKYKAEWRAVGEEVWHFKWYDAKEGKRGGAGTPFRRMGCSVLGRHCTLTAHGGGMAHRCLLLRVLQAKPCQPFISWAAAHPRPSRIRARSHLL